MILGYLPTQRNGAGAGARKIPAPICLTVRFVPAVPSVPLHRITFAWPKPLHVASALSSW